jgi:hypothetical protein
MGGYERTGRYGTLQEIPFTDGVWREVTVLGKARDTAGGWRVLLRWFDGGSDRHDWVMYDRTRFREPRLVERRS